MVIVCGICQSQLEHDPPQLSTELADRFMIMKTPDTNRRRRKQQQEQQQQTNIQDEMSMSNKKNEPDIVVTQCGHMFHNSCATEWYITIGQRKCPMCNTITPVHDMIRVYPSTSCCADSISDIRLPTTTKSSNNNNNNTASSDSSTPLIHPQEGEDIEFEEALNQSTTSSDSLNAIVDNQQQSQQMFLDESSEQNNDNVNSVIGQQQQQQRTLEQAITMANTSSTTTNTNAGDSSISVDNVPTTSTFNQQQQLESPAPEMPGPTPDPANATMQRTERIVNNIRTIFYRFLSSSSNNDDTTNNTNTVRSTNTENNQTRTSRDRWRTSLRESRTAENPDHSRSPYRPCRNCSALKRVQALMEKDLTQLRNRVADLSETLEQEKRKYEGMTMMKQETQNEIHQ